MTTFYFEMNHETYIKRCIELAKKALGNTYPNPLVGAIIVHDGKIIGEGYHKKAGEPHAEINAINSVKNPELLPDSTIYVSLEPCAHFGKTPPCSFKLREIGFKKVVIGSMDSHDKVNGKGKKILEDAGIETASGLLEEECRDLNKRFFTFHEKKRPYLILKWAESADGFMDKDFKPTKISNELASQWVHQMRSEEHAILVGTQTALTDNPSLTTRLVEGRNPVRILIDLDLKVPNDFHIFNEEAPTFIINTKKETTDGHLTYLKVSREQLLENLIQKLYENQIQSVLIEGGRYTLQQFIDSGLWDEAIIIKNENLYLGNGTKAPKISKEHSSEDKIRDNTLYFYHNS